MPLEISPSRNARASDGGIKTDWTTRHKNQPSAHAWFFTQTVNAWLLYTNSGCLAARH